MSGQRGHVRREGRSWRLVLRRSSEPGSRPRRFSVRLGSVAELPTRATARRAADRWLERNDSRRLHAGTVLEWAAWCDRYVDRTLRLRSTGTRTTQASIISRHLRPAFAGRPVHEITLEAVQEFVRDQARAGVAPATVRARFNLLAGMLRQAAADGLAVAPPRASSIEFPKDERVHSSVTQKAFTPEEVRRILEAATDPERTAYALARFAGLRAGEVLGLAWASIDLERGLLTIRQQALGGDIRPLKTRGSKATLGAPAALVASLRAYREAWRPNPGGFLFADDDGRPLTGATLRRSLHDLLERLGIRRRGMHAFRHACALAMANAGCSPEVIRRAMRHSTLKETAIYLSASPEDIAAGLERAANLPRATE